MSRIVFFLVGIAFLTACNSGESTEATDGTMQPLPPAHAEIIPYDDGSGLVQVSSFAADGTVLEQGDYLNNLREGVFTVFHPNGYVQTISGYVRGKKQGQELTLDNRGQLESRATYHQGILNGEFIVYNRSRIKEKRYYIDGELNGQLEKFYQNGNIMERTNYSNGQLDGVARWYDQEGNLTIEYTYKNGELVSTGEN